jgi:hypothetical protein
MQRLLWAFLLIASPCLAASSLENRPAFSEAERPPQRAATCAEIRSMAEGVEPSELRIDLDRPPSSGPGGMLVQRWPLR